MKQSSYQDSQWVAWGQRKTNAGEEFQATGKRKHHWEVGGLGFFWTNSISN